MFEQVKPSTVISPLLIRESPDQDLIHRRAPIDTGGAAIDDANRTVRVTFSTGADVQRSDFDGPYLERLSMNPDHVDLTRFIGASVLDSHRQGGLDAVLGTVESATTDGGRGVAVLRMSRRPGVEPIWQDIQSGVIKHVSVGYSVETWREERDAKGNRVKIAERWTPRELSFVAVAADPDARVRAAASSTADAEIRSIATVAGLGNQFAEQLITRGATPDQARRAALAEMDRRGGGEIHTHVPPNIVMGDDWNAIEERAAHIGEALYHRINQAHQPSAPARQYVGLSLVDIGRELLRLRGFSTTGMSPDTIITRASSLGGLHGTSDFALILADTTNRTMRAAYDAAPAGVRALAKQTTARDFRTKHRLQLGEAPTLQKVNEHGEFTSGTMAEAEETYKAETYGRIIGLTRQAMVNDDLGAFADLSARFGQAAAEFEAQTLVDLLASNAGLGPTLSDTKTLFHADHGNLEPIGGAITQGSLTSARTAMRLQTGLSGKPINVTPKFLLVPAAMETNAEQQVAAITPQTSADVNVFSGRLTVVPDARLDAKDNGRWYMVADPNQIDGLEYCYLEGAQGPQIESQTGFRVDGVEIKIRLDYGAGFVEYRSWYSNPG